MSERNTLLYNLSLFGLTSVLFLSYSVIFARHIYNGLSSDLLDELGKFRRMALALIQAHFDLSYSLAYSAMRRGLSRPSRVHVVSNLCAESGRIASTAYRRPFYDPAKHHASSEYTNTAISFRPSLERR